MPVNVVVEHPNDRELLPAYCGAVLRLPPSSPPNSRCQYRFDNTTVRDAYGASSSGSSVRPRRAATPSVEK